MLRFKLSLPEYGFYANIGHFLRGEILVKQCASFNFPSIFCLYKYCRIRVLQGA